MKRSIIEFLDPDGSYALVQPFDEVRGRVLSSNVLTKGRILHKDGEMAWADAAEDLGGFTRLGPSDFLPEGEAWPEPAWEEAELLEVLGDPPRSPREEPSLNPSLEVEGPPPGRVRPEPGAGEDPIGLLIGLVGHIRKVHEPKEGGSRRVAPCRCPGFQVKGDRLRKRLRELVTEALEEGRGPRLSRILVALQERLQGRSDAA